MACPAVRFFPYFSPEHQHSPKLLTHANSGEILLSSRNKIMGLYFLCSFCSFFTCLIIFFEHVQSTTLCR